LVEIICDTSFLVHLANNRIKNISTLDTDIGSIQFVVPDTVVAELEQLSQNPAKRDVAISTLDYIKRFKIIQMGGTFADSQFVSFVKKHGGTVATMDRELKQQIKKYGGSVLSISNNKIILE
jgi:uncharacterized protein